MPLSFQKLKYLIIPVVIAGLCALNLNSEKIDYTRFYNQNKGFSVEELKNRGNEYLLGNAPDSALLCYQIVTSRYTDRMSDEDKGICASAYNNIAYIYFYVFNDYTSAYQYLLKSLEIAQDLKNERLLPAIYLNIGNIYAQYNDEATALDYYKKSLRTAIDSRNFDNYMTTMSNVISQAYITNTLDSIQEELDAFAKLDFPDMPMLRTCRHLHAASAASQKGDDSTAIACLQKAYDSVDDRLSPGRFKVNISDLIAYEYARQHRYGRAIQSLNNSIQDAKQYDITDLLSVSYQNISEYYEKTGMADSAMAYKLKSVEIRDSLFNSKRYGMIKDLKSSYDIKVVNDELQDLIRKRETEQIILAIVSGSAIIVLIFLVVIYRKNRDLQESKEELFQKMQNSIAAEIKEREQRKIYENRIAELESEKSSRERPQDEPADKKEAKYQSSSLNDEYKQGIYNRILNVMENNADIFHSDFSIEKLSAIVGSKSKYVSQVINELAGVNFQGLIAKFRIREACLRLSDPVRFGHLTIESIASDLGFKSRSNFSMVFKKVTGLTPSEYQKFGLQTAKADFIPVTSST